MHTPAVNAALLELAAALPVGVGIAVVVVRGRDHTGHRRVHVCDHNMDADAFEVAGQCLNTMSRTDGEQPPGARVN